MSSSPTKTSPSSSNGNGQLLLPVLIIPGFMSSGLEVKESNVKPNWVGKRIWINLSSLGFQSIYWGSSQKQKTKARNTTEEELQMNYKSAWIKHMTLNGKDMKTEQAGVKVRAIEGLEGVDYLSPGALTNHVSYVFGPVIKALELAGYNANPSKPNLAASPYDWRIPPMELERRDHYFTKTIKLVEQLYKNNDDTPVVILGHSLGCKTAHYFLNFAKGQKGQKWLDQHVHTYMPVGAPHLGAPKALRSVIAGDKMSLDAFLSTEEALVLGRSLGSGPWLIPQQLPNGAPASAYILPHGVLQLSFVHAVDANPLVDKRENLNRPNKYQLQVVGRGLHGHMEERRIVRTPFHQISSDLGPDAVVFTDQISFSTLEKAVPDATLHFLLQEPGIGAAKKEKDDRGCCSLACCLAFVFCCCICALVYKILKCLTCGVVRSAALTADAITSTAGGGTTLAFSEAVKIPANVWKGQTVTLKVPIFHKDDYGKYDGWGCFAAMVQPRHTNIHVKIKWIPYTKQRSFKTVCSHVCQPAEDAPKLPIRHKSKSTYQELPGYDLIEREGLIDTTLKCIKDSYDGDKLLPRSLSSVDPPPVKRIHAIYGVNLPTEIGGAYKRRDSCLSEHKLESLYEPDINATLDKSTGYVMKGGLLFETPQSKQKVGGNKTRQVSGDGTVPFWSLEFCKSWNGLGGRLVTVQELEKAEHREILADARFHKAILNYCRK